tara:strand:- start:606 stop:1343 length:738 start_codon:yes stop_codon:yes gene_type:complete
MNHIENKVIMITGASSGFGKITAEKCVSLGAKVVLGARREDRLKDLCNQLGSDNAVYEVTDVSKKETVNSLALKGIETFGKIDALINNAGIMPLSLLEKGRTDEWDEMIDINIKGVLYGINSVYTHMLERGEGQIINIASTAGKRLMPGSAVYSATKFAVGAISEGLRMESAGKLQVTCIYPGAFQTELGTTIKDESMLEMLMKGNLASIAEPAERIADAIIYALQQDKGVSANEIVIRPIAQEM